jgi:hypothetical protein
VGRHPGRREAPSAPLPLPLPISFGLFVREGSVGSGASGQRTNTKEKEEGSPPSKRGGGPFFVDLRHLVPHASGISCRMRHVEVIVHPSTWRAGQLSALRGATRVRAPPRRGPGAAGRARHTGDRGVHRGIRPDSPIPFPYPPGATPPSPRPAGVAAAACVNRARAGARRPVGRWTSAPALRRFLGAGKRPRRLAVKR